MKSQAKTFYFQSTEHESIISASFPFYADFDLKDLHAVRKVVLPDGVPEDTAFRWYGSRDGLNFQRLLFAEEAQVSPARVFIPAQEAAVRVLRLQALDCPILPDGWLNRVQIEAEATGQTAIAANDPIAALPSWEDTEYASDVTEQDTEDYLSGLVGRVLGEPYQTWFSFRSISSPSATEQYRIFSESSASGSKIVIEGNSGVAMAAGLNRYLRDCCHVHIAEQEKQIRMPKHMPLPRAAITAEAQDRIRYANNYCTLSYTMPFWEEADWQRELDWLALCGVNVILDFTGMEAVWYLFLRRLGCTDTEIEQFIVGPCYTAWQLMQNIQGIGGPVHKGFIADRVKLARKNQRKMRLLGMSPVRQGYAGMLPDVCKKHLPDLTLFPQGTWCGIQRPSMLDPSSNRFDELADLFYQCQAYIYGAWSSYYAVDPYHEGGNRPASLTDAMVSNRTLSAMLRHDARAVWMVQAWRDNPSRAFLSGFTSEQRQRHLVILDLSATDNPLGGEDEFTGTPWIYCMLDMYGGRLSTHGELDALAEQIPEKRARSRYMTGIGSTAEASCHNPVVFDLLYEMAWHSQPVDVNRWVQEYAHRRYGTITHDLAEAWNVLLKTAYHNPGFSHHGGYTQMFTYRPRLTMHPGPVFNELNSEIIKLPYYDPKQFYRAVEAMMRAYETCKDIPCFICDLQDVLRQTLNLLGGAAALNALRAYREKDIHAFEEQAQIFLTLLQTCDRLMNVRQDTLLSAWSGQAAKIGSRYDDFSADLFALDARALITTWGYRETYHGLADYAYRQYGGLLGSFYQERWSLWFERLRQALNGGTEAEDISEEEWFWHDWGFVMRGTATENRETPEAPDDVFPRVMAAVGQYAYLLSCLL